MSKNNGTAEQPMRVLRLPEVCAQVGLSAPTVYRLVRHGTFPKSVQLSPGSVGWLHDEIAAWLAERVAERDRRDAGRAA